MEQTDRQTDKSTRWAFTAYEEQWHLFETVPEVVASIGWQTETAPETGRKHYQGYIQTKRQVRFAQLKKEYPGVHLEVARNWAALQAYCKKTESAVAGTQIQLTGTPTLTMKDALLKLASYYTRDIRLQYIDDGLKGKDVNKEEYWHLVRLCVSDFPNSIGLFANPIYLTSWVNTRQVWIDLIAQQNPNSVEETTP